MKRKLFLLFTASILSISCMSYAFASSNSFEPYFDENGTLIAPAGGYNGVLLEDKEEINPRMTPNGLFKMSYSISKKGGMVDTTGTSKHITSDDITHGVLEMYSSPDSNNKSGTLSIGLCYYDYWGYIAQPSSLRTSVSATEIETAYLYDPDLKEDKDYYGLVISKSSDYVSGSVAFNDLN
ncbi:hypothetical protein AAK894_09185 [Lachnospiraceae bacterium 46-61]